MVAGRLGPSRGLAARATRSVARRRRIGRTSRRVASGVGDHGADSRTSDRRRSSASACRSRRAARLPAAHQPSWPRDRARRAGRQQRRRRGRDVRRPIAVEVAIDPQRRRCLSRSIRSSTAIWSAGARRGSSGPGDVTTRAIVPAGATAAAMFLAKRALRRRRPRRGARSVRAGRSARVVRRATRTTATSVPPGDVIARVNGPAARAARRPSARRSISCSSCRASRR